MTPILLSMGDPCGIGPEIIARLFLEHPEDARHIQVVGDRQVMQRALGWVGAGELQVPVIQAPDMPVDVSEAPIGRVDARGGMAALASLRCAVSLIKDTHGTALVTAPLHKEALALTGQPYPGHTEMLQAWAGGVPVRMMLANEQLKTVLVTIHQSVRDAIDAICTDTVLQTIRITHEAAQRWGLPRARIAVAGLNPHAGEGGRFGREDIEHIAPAIAQARSEGIDASGPYPPDTVFMRARHAPPQKVGEFDVVVSMLHDHGLVAVKYMGLDEGVNVTLGLPYVRTSPDHGTAFDIAGQGLARPGSLLAAVRMARRLRGAP